MFVDDIAAFTARASALYPLRGEAGFRSDALIAGPYAGSVLRQEEHGALWDAAPHGLSVLVSGMGPIHEVAAAVSADGTYAFSCRHAAGGISSLDLNLRDPSVKLAERYLFANGETVELPGLSYNRKDTFQKAVGLLLQEISGGRSESRSRLGLGLHLVCVASAAQQSLQSGGGFVCVATPSV